MKKVLFAYPEFYLGGSTTSLISLLNCFDYNNYEVDLILYRKTDGVLNCIPKEVNLIGEACKFKRNSLYEKIRFFIRYLIKGHLFKAFFNELRFKRKIGFNEQILSKIAAQESVKVRQKYDIAIGFLEYWANDYVLNYIDADIKVAWIHTDYLKAEYVTDLDVKEFEKASKIVFVSQECLSNFRVLFPDLSDRLIVINNITSPQLILSKANEEIIDFSNSKNGLKIITVCRLDIYTKGIDRIVNTVKKLIDEGYSLRWYIVGEGPDRNKIEELIKINNLDGIIILMGQKNNPYPYMKKCDLFCMPSRYEGKPIAVTEAQIIGLPILVTNYSSAKEQVMNGIDGIIIENNDESLYFGLKNFLVDSNVINRFKKNLIMKQFGNENEIEKLYSIME